MSVTMSYGLLHTLDQQEKSTLTFTLMHKEQYAMGLTRYIHDMRHSYLLKESFSVIAFVQFRFKFVHSSISFQYSIPLILDTQT